MRTLAIRQWDDSAVDVIHDYNYVCIYCKMLRGNSSYRNAHLSVNDASAMLAHLERHRRHGHRVPEYAMEALRKDAGLPLKFPYVDWMLVSKIWWTAIGKHRYIHRGLFMPKAPTGFHISREDSEELAVADLKRNEERYRAKAPER